MLNILSGLKQSIDNNNTESILIAEAIIQEKEYKNNCE